MKVKVIRATRVGGQSVGPDKKGNPQVINVSVDEARDLIAAGKAVAVKVSSAKTDDDK